MPPVTAERSPPLSADHRRRLAGDGSLVDRSDAVDHLAVRGDDVACLHQHDVADLETRARHPLVLRTVGAGEELRLRLGTCAPERFRLRLAAALRHRLGEVPEEHREPEPEVDLEGEAQVGMPNDKVAQEEERGQRRHDLDDEHHRVMNERPRVELPECGAERRHHDRGVQERQACVASSHRVGRHRPRNGRHRGCS